MNKLNALSLVNNMKIDPSHSIYYLLFRLPKAKEVTIGRLGTFQFPAGKYIYVGSAKRHIEARIKRHLKLDKPQHWHFDYIRPYGEIIKVTTFNRTLEECERAHQLQQQFKASAVAKGFGSSDCKCETHFFHIEEARLS